MDKMDEVTRFNRNEENFLNSSRIIMRAIRSIEFKTGDTGDLIPLGIFSSSGKVKLPIYNMTD